MPYTDEQISGYWKRYKATRVLRTLNGGKWSYQIINGRMVLNTATRAEVSTLDKVMGFPEYLKRQGK